MTKPYLMARLKRDHPEILARLKAKKIKTVHAAAREAGIIKRSIELWPRSDPTFAARRVYEFFREANWWHWGSGGNWVEIFLDELARLKKEDQSAEGGDEDDDAKRDEARQLTEEIRAAMGKSPSTRQTS
jgi:hypothetical protein